MEIFPEIKNSVEGLEVSIKRITAKIGKQKWKEERWGSDQDIHHPSDRSLREKRENGEQIRKRVFPEGKGERIPKRWKWTSTKAHRHETSKYQDQEKFLKIENWSHRIRNQTSFTLLSSILQARNQWGKYVKTGKKKISHLLTLGQVWSSIKMFLEMWDLTNLPPMHPISKATRG